MIQLTGSELSLRLGIHRKMVQLLVLDRRAARNGLSRRVKAVTVDAAIVGAQIGVAQVLPHRPGLVERVLKVIPNHLGIARNLVARFAFIKNGAACTRCRRRA